MPVGFGSVIPHRTHPLERLPAHEIMNTKHPVSTTDTPVRSTLGFTPQKSVSDALRRVRGACALVLAGGLSAHAATLTWDGGSWSAGTGGTGTDWGTAANWRPDTVPADGDSVQFNAANLVTNASGTTTLDSNTVVMGNQTTGSLQVGQGISGTNIPAGSYITSIVNSTTVTISQNATASASNVGITVTNVGGLASSPVINLGANRIIDTLNLGNTNAFTLGSAADISSGYALTLSAVSRSNTAALTIASNVNLSPNAAGRSIWRDSQNGTTTVTGAVGGTGTVILNKGGTTGTVVMNGANTFTGSVVVDAGILSFGGTNAYTGTTTASGGTLLVNFNAGAAATPSSNIINSASGLVLGGVRGGGTVTVNGKNGTSVSQTFNGTTLNSGASTFNIANGTTANTRTLVNLGAITRNAGGTVNFVQPTGTGNTTVDATNGYTTGTANDTSGILGGYATVGGSDWAANNTTNIVAYTGYTANTWGTDINTNVTSSGTIADNSTTHSLRFNTAGATTLTLGGVNTLTSGGILVGSTVGNNLTTITGGTLQGSSGGELIIHQNNSSNSLTIASTIIDNTTASALTKSGAGILNLTGTLSYTGGTYVNAGTLNLNAGSTNPLATTGSITVTGGTLNFGAATTQAVSGAVVLAGGTISGGTITKSGGSYDVRNGTISSALAGTVGLTKTTSGSVTLSTASSYSGGTLVEEGSLLATVAGSIGTGHLTIGSLAGGPAASFTASDNLDVVNNSATVTVYSNGTFNFGNGDNIRDLVIVGGSVVTKFSYVTNSLTMTGGTISGTGGLNGTANSVTTLASDTTATISASMNLAGGSGTITYTVADGAAAIDLNVSGGMGPNNSTNVTKAGAGLMAVGSSNYTGITTVNGGTFSVGLLANGGTASGIGASASGATNLRLGNGATLQYTGSGHSTDRLFTVNGTAAGHSATLDASGTGAVNFTNTGGIAWGTTAQTRTLKLGGTSTAANTLSALIANNGGSAVSLTKQDAGKWVLANANTYTGATTISGGTLALGANNAIGAGSAVSLDAGTLDLQTFSTSAASLGFNAGSTLKFNLGTPGNVTALLALAGNFSPGAGSGSYTFDFSGSGAAGTYKLVSYAGTFFVDTTGFTVTNLGSGLTGELLLESNQLSLVVSAVPEPATYAAIFGALALLGAVWHSRKPRA